MTYPMVDQMRRQPRGARRVSRRDVLLEALRNTALFASATERDLRSMAKHAADRVVPAGKTLMKEGERGDRFYVVVDGCVRVTRKGRKITDIRAGRARRFYRVQPAGIRALNDARRTFHNIWRGVRLPS